MPDQIIVRDIARSDRDRWSPLWDGYNAFYGRSGATALAEPVTATLWERLFDPAEGRLGIIVTFLALLELAKEHLIELMQSEPLAPIYLKSLATG